MSIEPSCLGPAAQRQIAEKLLQNKHEKEIERHLKHFDIKEPRKYRNQPTMRGNIRFDSKKEARRYDELILMLKAGKIRNLKLQPEFTLQEAYTTPEGERIRAMKYRADFSYERIIGYYTDVAPSDIPKYALIVEDVKSRATKTRVYEIKKKLMQERFGIEITEIE